jgi:hypothetical protein
VGPPFTTDNHHRLHPCACAYTCVCMSFSGCHMCVSKAPDPGKLMPSTKRPQSLGCHKLRQTLIRKETRPVSAPLHAPVTGKPWFGLQNPEFSQRGVGRYTYNVRNGRPADVQARQALFREDVKADTLVALFQFCKGGSTSISKGLSGSPHGRFLQHVPGGPRAAPHSTPHGPTSSIEASPRGG